MWAATVVDIIEESDCLCKRKAQQNKNKKYMRKTQ